AGRGSGTLVRDLRARGVRALCGRMTTWQSVAKTADIPPERVAVFQVGDHEVAVCNVQGQFYAIDDLCTHDGGSLDQGELEDAEKRISEIACTGRGCSISQASASMMTEVVKGQTLDDAQAAVHRFTQRMANREPPPAELEDELDALQGVKKFPARVKCALLPWTTLRETVDLYRHREPSPVDVEGVVDCADAP